MFLNQAKATYDMNIWGEQMNRGHSSVRQCHQIQNPQTVSLYSLAIINEHNGRSIVLLQTILQGFDGQKQREQLL